MIRHQPTPEFVECLARRALVRFRDGGNPIRFMIANSMGFWPYVDSAADAALREGPWWKVSTYGKALVNEAMVQHLKHGVALRDAVKNLKRYAHPRAKHALPAA